MTSLLNSQRPPLFCPGCSHERVVQALDAALQRLSLAGEQVAIVSDIGCSGLFDTFFHTHALHGLHGRVLTYATGLKMARPELTVIAVMGDGGLGIGGAHVLSCCRRNLDITLLVLNNFNYGMTGGQCSPTTPAAGRTSSGYLNQLEMPLDICRVAVAAGAPWVERLTAFSGGLVERLAAAISFSGFAVTEIWSVCPGRYGKNNRSSPQQLAREAEELGFAGGLVAENAREEYGSHYRRLAAELPLSAAPAAVAVVCQPVVSDRTEVLILGAAGQYINTAGEILCLAGMSAGLQVSQKNDYPITVLRGHSVAEVVLDPAPIGYTGLTSPSLVLCLAAEGVAKRRDLFPRLQGDALVLAASEVELPPTAAEVRRLDFAALRLKPGQRALAAMALLAEEGRVLTVEMLQAGLAHRYRGETLAEARELLARLSRDRGQAPSQRSSTR
jgi:2-oxoglutarate/2-oxoacid ferredoxin oxidoreductase subunit beta